MAENYYLILGITSDATPDEIRAAYRRCAKELHPDRSGRDSKSFQDVQEAYTVLSDPSSRQVYDARDIPSVSAERPPVEPISSVENRRYFRERPVDLEDISLSRSFQTFQPSFEALFERLRRNFGPPGGPKSELKAPLHVEIILTPEEARRGGRIRVGVPAQVVCPTCRGQGRLSLWWCTHCEGAGRLIQEHPVTISFPPGIRGDHTLALSLESLGIHNLYLAAHFRVS